MRKSQNRTMGNRRRQGTMTPQKVTNHTIENLVDSKEIKPQFISSKEQL
jgi:hypothetical protein